VAHNCAQAQHAAVRNCLGLQKWAAEDFRLADYFNFQGVHGWQWRMHEDGRPPKQPHLAFGRHSLTKLPLQGHLQRRASSFQALFFDFEAPR